MLVDKNIFSTSNDMKENSPTLFKNYCNAIKIRAINNVADVITTEYIEYYLPCHIIRIPFKYNAPASLSLSLFLSLSQYIIRNASKEHFYISCFRCYHGA